MRHAVFLDRDGTLGGDGNYCHPDAFTLYPASCAAIKLLNDAGLPVIVVTNQTHIGQGEITLDQVEAGFLRLQRELATHGARLDGWYICPHTATQGCACRKPSPLLLERAAHDFGLDLRRCYMVGDSGVTDMLAGAAAGCRTVLVLTGWGRNSLGAYRQTWAQIEPDYVAEDLLDAVRFIREEQQAGTSEDPSRRSPR